MGKVFNRAKWCMLLCLSVLLSGCGGASLWPFGDKGQDRPVTPPNSTEYQCNAGKRFFLRELDGNAVWVIYPDRQIRLDKVASTAGARFSNGIAVFEIIEQEARLTDGPAISYSGCKKAP